MDFCSLAKPAADSIISQWVQCFRDPGSSWHPALPRVSPFNWSEPPPACQDILALRDACVSSLAAGTERPLSAGEFPTRSWDLPVLTSIVSQELRDVGPGSKRSRFSFRTSWSLMWGTVLGYFQVLFQTPAYARIILSSVTHLFREPHIFKG